MSLRLLTVMMLSRKNVPPYIRNLEDVEKLSEGKLKIPKDWPYKF